MDPQSTAEVLFERQYCPNEGDDWVTGVNGLQIAPL